MTRNRGRRWRGGGAPARTRAPATAALALALACRGDPDPCALGAPVGSVDDVVSVVGELPEPTLACFLTALERPLGVVLTSDVFSTQPAQGVGSPRILVRTDPMTLTVVPVGPGKDLLELGEASDGGLTVKAELHFPIEGPLTADAPYERVLASPGAAETGCRVCHFEEVALGGGRFASTPLRPPDGLVVPLEVLVDEHERCDPAVDAYRCAMFSALLDHGEVVERPFDPAIATEFGPPP